MKIRLKRVYDPVEPADGARVLVDRLWPRGISKEKARIDRWMKEIAPSDALRESFCHDVAKWDGFCDRYFNELDGKEQLVAELKRLAKEGPLTLLYAARDIEHNNAVVLKQYLTQKRNKRSRSK